MTEALVHTAAVPVAIAPRGYPQTPLPLERLTAAYGGSADAVGLLRMTAELAKSWSVEMRIAAFTVRPPAMFAGSIEPSAETLVIREWYASAVQGACDEIAAARTTVAVDNVDIVVGAGVEWRDAVDGIAWAPGDLLLLGSGAAGVRAQVFLGSAASRILRHAPVPVIIMPRT
nr:universal stress protein [Tetrasphaera japonica]